MAPLCLLADGPHAFHSYHRASGPCLLVQELCGGEGGGAAASTPAAGAGPSTGGAASSLPAVPRVRDMADVVCAEALEPYLGMELRWLYEARAAALGRGSLLSMELLLDLLAANEEVGRQGRRGRAKILSGRSFLRGSGRADSAHGRGWRQRCCAPDNLLGCSRGGSSTLCSSTTAQAQPLLSCSRCPTRLQAAARCALLSPPALLAANTRQLFHASTRKQANTGCLLEQVATHILVGLGAAMEGATRALLAPFRPHQLLDAQAAAAAGPVQAGSPAGAAGGQPQRQRQGGAPAPRVPSAVEGARGAVQASRNGSLPRASLQRAAALSVAGSVGQLLQAVSTIGAMARAVQQHYQRVLAPHLAGSGAEARACGAGLAALVRAVDERVAAALQRCLGLLRSQADMTLVAEQQRADFCPPEASPPPSLEELTPAAAAVCALLGAAVDAAEQHLHGPNLAAFLAEVR